MRPVAGVIGALGLLVAGCGRTEDTQDTSSSGDGERLDLLTPPPDYRGGDRVAPILDTVAGGLRADHVAIQAAIQACMAAAGFEYAPVPYLGEVKRGNVDDPELRAARGYGIAEALDTTSSAGVGTGDDPNRIYLDGLSDAQQRAYDEALFGTEASYVALTNESGENVGFYAATGCVAESYRSVLGFDNGQMQYMLDFIERLHREMMETMRADERWLAIWQEWSRCMAESGWEFEDRDATITSILEDAGTDAARGRALETSIVQADNACSSELDTDRQVWVLKYTYQEAVLQAIASALESVPGI